MNNSFNSMIYSPNMRETYKKTQILFLEFLRIIRIINQKNGS